MADSDHEPLTVHAPRTEVRRCANAGICALRSLRERRRAVAASDVRQCKDVRHKVLQRHRSHRQQEDVADDSLAERRRTNVIPRVAPRRLVPVTHVRV